MTKGPRVSVVTIFLNAEPFLAEAVESVLAQTHSSWELLLVDDGSTDGSSKIGRRYAASNPERVRYLTHPNRRNMGMSASRNLGISQARGEYVAFLDADDAWLPQKLEQQVALLDSEPRAAMVYGPAEWWYSWSGRAEDSGRDFVHELGVPADHLIEPPALLIAFLRDEGISPCTCSVLIRRHILARVGGFEARFRGLYEDQVLSAKVCLEYPVFASGVCHYRYRQHESSAMALADMAQRRHSRIAFLDWLGGYVAEHEPGNDPLKQVVSLERRRSRHPRLDAALRRGRSLQGLVRGAAGKAKEGSVR